MRLKSKTYRLCIQADNNENIKASHHWPLWVKLTNGFLSQGSGIMDKRFHIFMSSWNIDSIQHQIMHQKTYKTHNCYDNFLIVWSRTGRTHTHTRARARTRTHMYLVRVRLVTCNSLWPSDVIWLDLGKQTTASHYTKQCWLIFGDVLWYSPEDNFKVDA